MPSIEVRVLRLMRNSGWNPASVGFITDARASFREVIAEQLGLEETEVLPESSFVEDLGADSLDTVELVMAFEEEFGIEIPDEDAEKILTVQNVIDYIKERAQ